MLLTKATLAQVSFFSASPPVLHSFLRSVLSAPTAPEPPPLRTPFRSAPLPPPPPRTLNSKTTSRPTIPNPPPPTASPPRPPMPPPERWSEICEVSSWASSLKSMLATIGAGRLLGASYAGASAGGAPGEQFALADLVQVAAGPAERQQLRPQVRPGRVEHQPLAPHAEPDPPLPRRVPALEQR